MSSTGAVHDGRTLDVALGDAARRRLAGLVAEVEADPERVRTAMPAAARLVARGPLDASDPRGLLGPTLDDAVRAELLVALARATSGQTDRRWTEVHDLYRYGDADEKRAVLRSLHLLGLGDAALPLVHDGLRTNDPRLVAAGMGLYAERHLDADAWRQGVLKCLFVGVPLAAVSGLRRRTDRELFRMLASYAEERRAAGREVPADALALLDASAPDSEET